MLPRLALSSCSTSLALKTMVPASTHLDVSLRLLSQKWLIEYAQSSECHSLILGTGGLARQEDKEKN